MFLVLEGEAQVDVGGRFHPLRSGDVFGEMALLTPDRRMATVRAVEPVRALKAQADVVRSLLLEHPELGSTENARPAPARGRAVDRRLVAP
jgi:CRP-like cAMP-binding protein